MSSQQAWQVPYAYPLSGKSIPHAFTKLTIVGPFSTKNVDENNNPAPPGASFQQNVNAVHHWYQNCLMQTDKGAWYWFLENFTQDKNPDGTWKIKPDGSPVFPKDGQLVRGTTPAGIQPGTNDITPAIPTTIQLQNGGYYVRFFTEDNGKDTIRQKVEIYATKLDELLYESPWVIVAWGSEMSGTSGEWYDPLTAVALDPADVGGYTTTFSGGPFIVEHECGVDDLTYGGLYYTQDFAPNDLAWYPHTSPAPPVNVGSAENSNLRFLLDAGEDSFPTTHLVLAVDGFKSKVLVHPGASLAWEAAGAKLGAEVQFGHIGHGVDPAPPGAGFIEDDRKVSDSSGVAWGVFPLPPSWLSGDFDVYAFDTGIADPTGYSQPVQVNISNSLVFRGTPN